MRCNWTQRTHTHTRRIWTTSCSVSFSLSWLYYGFRFRCFVHVYCVSMVCDSGSTSLWWKLHKSERKKNAISMECAVQCFCTHKIGTNNNTMQFLPYVMDSFISYALKKTVQFFFPEHTCKKKNSTILTSIRIYAVLLKFFVDHPYVWLLILLHIFI